MKEKKEVYRIGDQAGIVKQRVVEAILNLQKLLADSFTCSRIEAAARLVVKAVAEGGKLMVCGNGGSAADAQHVAGEFVCRFYEDRLPLPAIALSTDTSVLTALSNDYCYDDVFSRQVAALGKEKDVLLGISTSGNSRNVINALKAARRLGMGTLLLTGASGGESAAYADIVLKAPSMDTPRVQEMHLLIEHLICEMVERETR